MIHEEDQDENGSGRDGEMDHAVDEGYEVQVEEEDQQESDQQRDGDDGDEQDPDELHYRQQFQNEYDDEDDGNEEEEMLELHEEEIEALLL